MLKFYARLSKGKKALFDFIFWTVYFLLLLVLSSALGVMTLEEETGMPVFTLNTVNTLYVFGISVLFPIVRIILYKGEKKMAIEYQKDRKAAPSGDTAKTDEHTANTETPETRVPARETAPPCEVKGIGAEPYHHQNLYVGASVEKQKFMTGCSNTYVLSLSKTIEVDGKSYEVPNEYRSFYLHFEFVNEQEKADSVTKDVVTGIRFSQISCSNQEIILRAEASYKPYLGNSEENEEETVAFRLILGYKERNNEIPKIYMLNVDYQEERIHLYQMRTILRQMFHPKKAGMEGRSSVNNDMGTIVDFPYTTRKRRLYAIGSTAVRFRNRAGKPVYYTMNIQCYKNICRIRCPICRKPVKGLGVPGIVLYGSANLDAFRTSEKLRDYLTRLQNQTTRDPEDNQLLETVNAIAEANYTVTSRNNHLPENWSYESLKSNLRIPLGSAVIRTDGRFLGVDPYDCTTKAEEKKFLDRLNRELCPDLEEAPDGLYLLSPDETFRKNHYIHNTMISQLCTNCWNPLPKEFYLYDAVVSIYFYGNSNAGKTVLLLSEKNELGNDARFNNYYIHCDNFDYREERTIQSTLDYPQKAVELRNGRFPIGTARSEVIPGLLSSFSYDMNGIDDSYLFNYQDMPGVDAVRNWDAATNFAYVYNMLDDPASLGSGSFYHKLMGMIGDTDDPREYNIQIYLTKIDEYPAFLSKEIQALNACYEQAEGRADVLAYTVRLLTILEENLREDFSSRPACEVISDSIQKELHTLDWLGKLDFREKTYAEIHEQIYRVCRPYADTEHDRKKEISEIILRYLHGLDVIRDNYAEFRRLLKKLMEDMKNNIAENENSNYWFSIYAVSATGFSAIESKNGTAKFSPQFVMAAHRMLQQTTYDYIMDSKMLLRKREGLGETRGYITCRQYLFDAVGVEGAEGSVCDTIIGLCSGEMKKSDLYRKNAAELQRMKQTAVVELAFWYLEKLSGKHTLSGSAAPGRTSAASVHAYDLSELGVENVQDASVPAKPVPPAPPTDKTPVGTGYTGRKW